MKRGTLLCCAAISLAAQDFQVVLEKLPQTWNDAYTEGLRFLKEQNHREALRHFQQAVRLKEKPEKEAYTAGYKLIAYYPYLGVARAALGLGDLATAESALRKSQAFGVEPKAEREALQKELDARKVLQKKQEEAVQAKSNKPKPEPSRPEPVGEKPAPELPPDGPKDSPKVLTQPPVSVPVEGPRTELAKPGGTASVSKEPVKVGKAEPQREPPKTPMRSEAKLPAPEVPEHSAEPRPVTPPSGPNPRFIPLWALGGGGFLVSLVVALAWKIRRRQSRRNPYGIDLRGRTSGSLRRSMGSSGSGVEATALAPSLAPTPEQLGPYHVVELLGRGGCATTFLAVHERTGQQAALKVPHPHVLADPDFRTRFWREAELGQLLDHPRIPRILGAGTDDAPWLAMEYVAGITLEDHLRQVNPLPLSQVIHIGLDVAEALAHAHAKGVVHRDLKPSNIMLGADGAMVLDFGIARLVDTSQTASALLIGTPTYFAPEGLQSARVGPPADRYGLGIILFEMLTGQKPFSGDNPFHILEQHRVAPMPELEPLRADVPPKLARLVARLCRKEPGERPEDPEVLEILQSLRGTHPL